MVFRKVIVPLISGIIILSSTACDIYAGAGSSGKDYIPPNSISSLIKSFQIVSPATTLPVGNKLKLVPVVVNGVNAPVEKPSVEWSVSDSKVASIDKDGNLTALSDGSVVVTGRVGDKAAVTTITVTKLPEFAKDTVKDSKEPAIKANPSLLSRIKNIVLKLPSDATPLPEYKLDTLETTSKFEAIAYDLDNKPLEGVPFTWLTSNSAVVTVNNKGVVTPFSTGAANIIATAGDKNSNIIRVVVPNGKANISVNFQGD